MCIRDRLYAIGPGGLLGVGFDKSIQKHFYLPEPQTDFIFAIVAEEYGFIGGVILIGLYLILFKTVLKVSQNVEDLFCLLYTSQERHMLHLNQH